MTTGYTFEICAGDRVQVGERWYTAPIKCVIPAGTLLTFEAMERLGFVVVPPPPPPPTRWQLAMRATRAWLLDPYRVAIIAALALAVCFCGPWNAAIAASLGLNLLTAANWILDRARGSDA